MYTDFVRLSLSILPEKVIKGVTAGNTKIARSPAVIDRRYSFCLQYLLRMTAHSARLYNKDLAPTSPEQRTWGTYNFAALWISMAHCIPTYMLASGLIGAGMSWRQALLTILLGNIIVLIPILLNSHPGTKYGIPFPVFARAAYGTRGSNVPALMRALVACGWFGIQAWIGGQALHVFFRSLWP